MPRWLPPTYRLRFEFDVPLAYAFRWCTDYRSDDGGRAGEGYERRIVERTRRRVVYEDLWWEKDGWRWRRYSVTLRPPDRWHADSVGNVRDATIDYRLTPLPGDRTRFEITLRRRPVGGHAHPTKAAMEADLVRLWTNYHRAMVRDYRRSKHRRPK